MSKPSNLDVFNSIAQLGDRVKSAPWTKRQRGVYFNRPNPTTGCGEEARRMSYKLRAQPTTSDREFDIPELCVDVKAIEYVSKDGSTGWGGFRLSKNGKTLYNTFYSELLITTTMNHGPDAARLVASLLRGGNISLFMLGLTDRKPRNPTERLPADVAAMILQTFSPENAFAKCSGISLVSQVGWVHVLNKDFPDALELSGIWGTEPGYGVKRSYLEERLAPLTKVT